MLNLAIRGTCHANPPVTYHVFARGCMAIFGIGEMAFGFRMGTPCLIKSCGGGLQRAVNIRNCCLAFASLVLGRQKAAGFNSSTVLVTEEGRNTWLEVAKGA